MRDSWEKYFLDHAVFVASKSTCVRRKVGAVLVKDKRILSSGFNGAPSGLRHCMDIGCERQKLHVPSGERAELCRGIHAEQNAIIQAAVFGVSIKNSTLFCTTFPCSICTKMIINADIYKIFYLEGYPDKLSVQLMKEAEIKCIKFK